MPYDLSRLALLIVEAEEPLRTTWRSLLAGFGIRSVRFAASGREAWAVLTTGVAGDSPKPDILVCRDSLPNGEAGLELVARLRTDAESPNPFLPVVIVTASVTRGKVRRTLDAGVHEILALPLSAKALEGRLRGIVEKPRKFVRGGGYFGPDRRRLVRPDYAGPFRRGSDGG